MANLAEVNKTLVQQNEILIGIAQSTDATEKMMLDEIRKTNKFTLKNRNILCSRIYP